MEQGLITNNPSIYLSIYLSFYYIQDIEKVDSDKENDRQGSEELDDLIFQVKIRLFVLLIVQHLRSLKNLSACLIEFYKKNISLGYVKVRSNCSAAVE